MNDDVANDHSGNTNETTDNQQPQALASNRKGAGIAIGIGIGTAIGAAMDNIGAGIAIGVAIGLAIGTMLNKQWCGMDVSVFQVPYDSGHRSVRMGQGPEWFIENGLAQRLREAGHHVEVVAIEAQSPFRTEIGTGFELCRLLSPRVQEAVMKTAVPWKRE